MSAFGQLLSGRSGPRGSVGAPQHCNVPAGVVEIWSVIADAIIAQKDR